MSVHISAGLSREVLMRRPLGSQSSTSSKVEWTFRESSQPSQALVCEAFVKDEWTGQRHTGCEHLQWHIFKVFNYVIIWKKIKINKKWGRAYMGPEKMKNSTFFLPGCWQAWEQIIAKALKRPILFSQFSTQKTLNLASLLFEEPFVLKHTLIRWSQKGATLKLYTNLASK